MSERRQHTRLSIAADVDFGSENNFYSARTRDISVGGLFIDTETALPLGARVRVYLKFLKRQLQVEAEVAWVLVGEAGRTVGVGVRFIDLPDPARKSIESFMVLREPMPFRMIEDDDGTE